MLDKFDCVIVFYVRFWIAVTEHVYPNLVLSVVEKFFPMCCPLWIQMFWTAMSWNNFIHRWWFQTVREHGIKSPHVDIVSLIETFTHSIDATVVSMDIIPYLVDFYSVQHSVVSQLQHTSVAHPKLCCWIHIVVMHPSNWLAVYHSNNIWIDAGLY